MDSRVDEMTKTYDLFMAAVAEFMEAKQLAGAGKSTAATSDALEKLMARRESFMHACDKAQDEVEHAKQRLRFENMVDVGTGSSSASASTNINPPGDHHSVNEVETINAVGMEKTNRAIKLMEEQQPSSSRGRNIDESCEGHHYELAALTVDAGAHVCEDMDVDDDQFEADLTAFAGVPMEGLGFDQNASGDEFDSTAAFGDVGNLVEIISRKAEVQKEGGNEGGNAGEEAGREVVTSKAQLVFKEGESADQEDIDAGKTETIGKQGDNSGDNQRVLSGENVYTRKADTFKERENAREERSSGNRVGTSDAQVLKGSGNDGDERISGDRVDTSDTNIPKGANIVGDEITPGNGVDSGNSKVSERENAEANFDDQAKLSEGGNNVEVDSGEADLSKGEKAGDHERIPGNGFDVVMSEAVKEENAGAEKVSREEIDTAGKVQVLNAGDDQIASGSEVGTGNVEVLKGGNVGEEIISPGTEAGTGGSAEVSKGAIAGQEITPGDGVDPGNAEVIKGGNANDGRDTGHEVDSGEAQLFEGETVAEHQKLSGDGFDSSVRSEVGHGENSGDKRVSGGEIDTAGKVEAFQKRSENVGEEIIAPGAGTDTGNIAETIQGGNSGLVGDGGDTVNAAEASKGGNANEGRISGNDVDSGEAELFERGKAVDREIISGDGFDTVMSEDHVKEENAEVIDTGKVEVFQERENAGDDQIIASGYGVDTVSEEIFKGENVGEVIVATGAGAYTGSCNAEIFIGGNAGDWRASGGEVDSCKTQLSGGGNNITANERVSGDGTDSVMEEGIKKEDAGDEKDTVMSEAFEGENAAEERVTGDGVDTVMSEVFQEENTGTEVVLTGEKVDTGKVEISKGSSDDVKIPEEEVFAGKAQVTRGTNAGDEIASGGAEDSGNLQLFEGGNYSADKKDSGDEIGSSVKALVFEEGKIADNETETDKALVCKQGVNAVDERDSGDGVDTVTSEFLKGENSGDKKVTGDGVQTGEADVIEGGTSYIGTEGKISVDKIDTKVKAEVFSEGKNAGEELDSTDQKKPEGAASGTVVDTLKAETTSKKGENGGDEPVDGSGKGNLPEDAMNPVNVEAVDAGKEELISEDGKVTDVNSTAVATAEGSTKQGENPSHE